SSIPAGSPDEVDFRGSRRAKTPAGGVRAFPSERMEEVSAPTVTVDRLLERPPTSQIGSLARRAALWTCGVLVGGYLVSMAATAILARILTATDYGIIGMVMTLTSFFYFFSDMGLSWAI